MQKWCALGNSESKFSEYFRLHKLQHIRNCMTAELHAIVGLSFPPKPGKRQRNEIFKPQINSSVADICGKRSRGASETLVHWMWQKDAMKII